MKKYLLLLCAFFSLLAPAFSQTVLEERITVVVRDLSLEDALVLLARRAGVGIAYSSEVLPKKVVSLNFRNTPLQRILDNLLADTFLTYRRIGRQIVIVESTPPPPPRSYTVSGFLEDADTGEPLIAASIFDLESKRGAVTNEYGFFSLSLPPGEAQLSFSYLGYQTEIKFLQLSGDRKLRVSLPPTQLTATEVIVVADDELPPAERRAVNDDFITAAQIEHLPSLGGESDLIRTTHLLPGVQTGADGVGGIHVRGGNPGQNLILIDGVPVYNVLHAAGVLSVFNTNAVRSAKLIKGGFPARYGGRLSSVLDVRTKEGNKKEMGGSFDLGLLSARFSLEGPIVTDKSSFFVSGRWSFLDQYIQPVTRDLKTERNEDGAISYQFYDLNAKFNYAFSDRDKIYLSYYRGSDAFLNDGESSENINVRLPSTGEELVFRYDRSFGEGSDWGNNVSALRWNHLFSNKLFANTTLTFSQLAVDVNYRTVDSLVLLNDDTTIVKALDFSRYRSGIRDLGARVDFDYLPNSNHYVRFGAGLTRHRFTPGALILEGSTITPDEGQFLEEQLSSDLIATTEYNLYLEDEWTVNRRLSLNIGAHLAGWSVGGRSYFAPQPRLSAYWKAGKNLGLRAAVSKMTQFLHLLSNSGYGLPTDLWVPSTVEIGPQHALQGEIGMDYDWAGTVKFSADAYYKHMHDLLTYTEGANFLNDWENNVTVGEGRGYGLEFLLKKYRGKTRGWIGYALARADRRFDRVNGGLRYPFRFDHRHDLKVVLTHRFTSWLEFSANWVFSSGLAYSLPLEAYSFVLPDETDPPVTVFDFGEKNRFRLPSYHRLDATFNLTFQAKEAEHQIQVGGYNVYARKNPLYYSLRSSFVNVDGALQQQNEFVQVWLLPFLPVLNYSVKF